MNEYDIKLSTGREVRMSGTDWQHACQRAADLYSADVVAWRNPPVSIHVGMGVCAMTTTLLTATQAGERLGGVSDKTLANWRSQGSGPAYVKVGGSVRYRLEDLDDYLDGRRITPTNPQETER